MSSGLRRRLGLYSVFTVSVGAMIGSGIFVLPGLAFEVGGPAVILAYVLAGVIVLPAALAKAEMATAMPRAGGTYLYIDLAIGPMMGTIAGFGVWVSLVFKSAFALDGLGLYLGLFTDVHPLFLGLVIGLGLLLVNLAGIRQSGIVQSTLVTVVFVILLVFVGGGATLVERDFFHPFFEGGAGALLTTAGVVFVSYAGVTKVASIAEEVANPARTLPVAIVSSLLVMMFVYPAVTYVMVGVTPPAILRGDLTPLATAGSYFFPGWMTTVVAVVGVLALTSMANAGLLASSRYPFAMARRRLVPQVFTQLGTRSGAPTLSLVLTGALLLALMAFLPVFELAKLASAFQLLVFAMINVAQLAFRSSKLWWYRPKFTAPGYPWVPILGILACLVLITELGLDALLGAAGIIVTGLVWYQLYGRSRAIKESALRESVRQQSRSRLLELTERALSGGARRVAVVTERRDGDDGPLLRIARALVASDGPERISVLEPGDGLQERIMGIDPDLIVSDLGDDGAQSVDGLPADRDVVLSRGREPEKTDLIAVLGSGGPYDVLKISLAARLAETGGAAIRFVHVLDPGASRAQVRSLERLHSDLGEVCEASNESMVLESEDLLEALRSAVADADLAIVGAPQGRRFRMDLVDRIVEAIPTPVLIARGADRDQSLSVRRFWDRVVAGGVSRGDADGR